MWWGFFFHRAGFAVGEEEEDREVYAKCPACGRVPPEGCEHASAEDLEALRRLIRADIAVFESEEELLEEEILEDAPEEEARGRDLYRLVEPAFTLEDVVLSPRARESLEDALVELRHKSLLFDTWGLNRVVRRRKGLNLLFAGPPGTGKTMTAEALAHAMAMPLMVVDYAQLENMWVGETEKNIERVFAGAREENAVLFFDEADAVFYRRGQTAAPWANRDVNVLLNALENFEGVAILATNMASYMDRALDRRVDLVIEFPFPDAAMREEIYRRTVPRDAPLADDIDFGELARRFPLAGGHILNVVRQALRYAARREGTNRRVTMADFRQAARREEGKAQVMTADHLERRPSPSEDVRYHG